MSDTTLVAALSAFWSDWDADDVAYIIDNFRDTDQEPENLAHGMWTMGASLKHPKCIADQEADYECVCKPCNRHLKAVARVALALEEATA